MTYEERARLDEVARSTPTVPSGPPYLRRRRLRRGPVIGAAAAALALVVAVPAVALRDRSTGGTGTLAADTPDSDTRAGDSPAPTGRPAPPAPGGGLRVPGPVPGLSAVEARTLARGCGQAYGGDIGHVNATPEPGQTQGPLVRDAVRVFNAVRDAAGLHVLLYGPGTQLSCDVDGDRYSAGGSSGDPATFPVWLPGAVSVDSDAGTAGSVVVEGRVTGAVTSVVVTIADHTLRVTPVNGTYIARLQVPVPPEARLGVTAYQGGKELGQAGAEPGCFTDPAGAVVIGSRDSGTCRPATPWR